MGGHTRAAPCGGGRMSTEIEPVEERLAGWGAGSDLMSWAYAAQKAHEVALSLAETSFVPKSMYRKPGEVTGAILAGQELGLGPMSALAGIDVIDGTPALRATTLRGLVQAHGHEIWVEESTETRAIVCGRRRDSQRVERSVWTMDRARKAGLANKRNWVNHPQSMLVARGTSEVSRLVAADVLLGMPYSAEELADEAHEVAPVTALAARKRTAQRRNAPMVDAELPAEDVPADVPANASEPQTERPPEDRPPTEAEAIAVMEEAGLAPEVISVELSPPTVAPAAPEVHTAAGMTDAQRKRLAVEMRKAGLVERADRLAYASRVVGRELASSTELSTIEATQVIQALIDDEGDE